MNNGTYFKSIYNLPYTNDVSLSAAHIDFLVRYENLQTDFADALKQIGIEQKRALPSVNTTKQKTLYLDYYTPNIIGRAKRVFGPFMQEWGYEMPPAWGDVSISPFDKGFYRAVNFAKNIYWRYTWSKIEMKNRAPVHAH
jgi:hypothetical protein